MAAYCTLKEKSCVFAGKYKASTHCGLKTGISLENKIVNMTKCPYKPKKRN
tara:strand:- start:118 stop:270 length:153 start_codon:yes stop_codon:yes gene_type:complete